MFETNSGSSDVVNYDTLTITELLSRCDFPETSLEAKEMLKNKTEVSVGFNDLNDSSKRRHFKPDFETIDWLSIDITRDLNFNGNHIMNDERLMTRIVHFPNIKRLFLANVGLNYETMEIFVNQWPQLHELCLYDIDGPIDETASIQWADLLFKVTHLTVGKIGGNYVSFWLSVVSNLSRLQCLIVWPFKSEHHLSPRELTLSSLHTYMPANIQSLHYWVTILDTKAIASIASRFSKLRELVLNSGKNYAQNEINEWNKCFKIICDKLYATLERLDIVLGDMSAEKFAQSLAILDQLKHLRVSASHTCRDNSVLCLNTANIEPMPKLHTLEMYGVKSSPKLMAKLSEVWPNLRRVSVDSMYWHMDCKAGYQCDQCMAQCMAYVSKLEHLEDMIIVYDFSDITLKTLKLFSESAVKSLSIHAVLLSYEIEELIQFVTQTLANRKTKFYLNLKSCVKKQLMARMKTLNVQMPDNVKIGQLVDTQPFKWRFN